MLNINNISFSINDKKILSEVTFQCKTNRILAILGPNGAGKSSTFGMLAMDLPISQGDAFILNENISHINLTKEGRDLGMCP